MNSLELKNHRFNLIWRLLYIVIGLTFIAFSGVQTGKYLLERARIDVTRAALSTGVNQHVEVATSAPVSAPFPADKQVSVGVYILREMLEILPETLVKDKSGSSGASVEWGKFATTAIDKLVGAGKMTVKEANSLRQELLKPTIDVGVYASKAAVDRFISGKVAAKSETADKAGVASAVGNHVEITMYGGKEHVAVAMPKPPTKPAPCDKAPATDKKPTLPQAACKTSQAVQPAVPLPDRKAD
jgi:hypothetical protein